jgi:hypothetical protein|tara:strand:- start:353 stop:556 length:204 start_codon:yes stop_codon:yes gene_type:complete
MNSIFWFLVDVFAFILVIILSLGGFFMCYTILKEEKRTFSSFIKFAFYLTIGCYFGYVLWSEIQKLF